MASLLSTKQISALLKTKRRQFVENAVGLAPISAAGTPPKDTVVLVFNIKSLPNRAALAARKQFADADLKLRKVPNGVVKAAARNTPFVHMMTGPTMIATPANGKEFSLKQIVEVARNLKSNDKINKGLLFTGLVHKNVYLTPKRLEEIDWAEADKIPSLVAQAPVRILQMLNYPRFPTLATLRAYHEKKAKEGDMAAIEAVKQ